MYLLHLNVGCLKGGVDANPNDPETALKVAMEEYNKASPDIYLYKVMKVIKVQIKVGFEYTLTVTIARTVCKKGSMADVDGPCPIFTDPEYQCRFVVFHSEWFQRWVLLENKCS
uniref:Cystatin domain-containing protein n=1 Tax=Oryzias sinensis TaxID=183150 RepID=A0A8C7ZF18_9TELE